MQVQAGHSIGKYLGRFELDWEALMFEREVRHHPLGTRVRAALFRGGDCGDAGIERKDCPSHV
jgi:hypothetical protein